MRRRLISGSLEWEAVNDRLIWIRIRGQTFNTVIIQCYAPTDCHEDELEKDEFYKNLQKIVDMVKPKDYVVIMGDFNARVGLDAESYQGVIGKHGINDWSEIGGRLLNFCAFNQLAIAETKGF